MKIADAPSTGIAWHCTSCTNTCINTTSGQIVQSQIVLVQKCIVMDFSSPAETYRRFPGLHPHPYSLSHLTWSIFLRFERHWRSLTEQRQCSWLGRAPTTKHWRLRLSVDQMEFLDVAMPCDDDVERTLKIPTLTWYPTFRTENLWTFIID